MSKPLSVLEQERQNSRYKDRLLIVAGVFLLLLTVAYFRMPTKFVVYQPPVADEMYIAKIGTVPPTSVYSFSNIMLDRLLRCASDCEKDVLQNLQVNRSFLTESCFHDLETHVKINPQLYKNRTRELLPVDATIFSFDKVQMINGKTWLVTENYRLDTKVRGQSLRNEEFKYTMRVLKTSQSPDINPYQLQLDCYIAEPVLASVRR